MAGLAQAEQQAALDYLFPTSGASDFIAYSANGSSETASLARTAIGATGWAAATAATPSVKSNSGVLTSAAATGAVTITHFAVYTESSAGAMRTDWTALDSSRTLAIDDTVSWAAGALDITLD